MHQEICVHIWINIFQKFIPGTKIISQFRQHTTWTTTLKSWKSFFSILKIYYGRECRLWRRIFLQSNPLSQVIYHFLYNNKCDLYHLSRSCYYLNTTNVLYNYRLVKTYILTVIFCIAFIEYVIIFERSIEIEDKKYFFWYSFM